MMEDEELKIIKKACYDEGDKYHDARSYYIYQLVSSFGEVLYEADTLPELFLKIINNKE